MFRNRSWQHALGTLFAVALLAPVAAGAGSPPAVTNVTAQQRPATFLVDVGYDLADADSDSLYVWLLFSSDAGANWSSICRSVSGDVGAFVRTGTGRHIVWDARADAPGLDIDTCRLRVVADDEAPRPSISNLRRLANARADTLAFAPMDTIAFGRSFGFVWSGSSATTVIYPPAILAQMDTVPPLDGVVGYQYGSTFADCPGPVADCWLPRRFVEVSGDSVPFFAPVPGLWFANDGSSPSIFGQRLPSGVHKLRLNAVDVDGNEIVETERAFPFVINYDPQTRLLDGEIDWAHPDDLQAYPYYIRLNDPTQAHHAFHSGDRIPDRTYVVVKALGREDPRDLRVDTAFAMGFTGYLQGVRSNFTGGAYPFSSQAAAIDTEPQWGQGADGWYGETLGFLTAPSTRYTINMQSIDEHARRDATPARLSFDVGYEPCLQCIEIMPDTTSASAFPATTPCVEDASEDYLATHPCLAGTTMLRVAATGVPPVAATDLQRVTGTYYTLVNRQTGYVTNLPFVPVRADSIANYVLQSTRYWFEIRLHGQDDPAEAWSQPVRRVGGIQYQVNYDCDPYNLIQDGGGYDQLSYPTWGRTSNSLNLMIDAVSGLWKVRADVYVPTPLLTMGLTNFRFYVNAVVTSNNAAATDMVVDAVTRQFGDGWVDAVVLDQTTSAARPPRPSIYNFFGHVRPSITLATGQTWRDAGLAAHDITFKLALANGAMASLGGTPVRKHFRLMLQPAVGPALECGAK